MPSTKLPFFRYMLIDQMLRSKHKPFPTKEELLEACKEKFGVVSASTIEKDIGAMRIEFDAPIIYNRRCNGYEYSDKKYKFLSVNLSERNLLALSFVETILGEFRDLPIFDEFSDAVDKVLDGLEITRNLGDDMRKMHNFIQIDKSPYYKGSELLSDLITLITSKTPAEMVYKKFNSDHQKYYTIHPYLLKEYKNMWYVIGYVEEYQQVRIFALDRIVHISTTERSYIAPTQAKFDAQSFYKHCIGVSVLDQAPEKVVLRFSPSQGQYLKVQPLHTTQRVLEDSEQTYMIEIEVIVNYELKMQLLSYGANVSVVHPQSLAEIIRTELIKTLQHYETEQAVYA